MADPQTTRRVPEAVFEPAWRKFVTKLFKDQHVPTKKSPNQSFNPITSLFASRATASRGLRLSRRLLPLLVLLSRLWHWFLIRGLKNRKKNWWKCWNAICAYDAQVLTHKFYTKMKTAIAPGSKLPVNMMEWPELRAFKSYALSVLQTAKPQPRGVHDIIPMIIAQTIAAVIYGMPLRAFVSSFSLNDYCHIMYALNSSIE